MLHQSDRFFVLTGGPGAGKTTLIEALRDAGFATTTEAGRAIIRDQLAIGRPALPSNDPALFAELMLSWDMRSYRSALGEQGAVFFDRGVTDLVGYFALMGLPVPAHVRAAAAHSVTPPRLRGAALARDLHARRRKEANVRRGRTHPRRHRQSLSRTGL